MTWLSYPSWLNPGDNAWQMTAATFVGLMSLPGLAVLLGAVVLALIGLGAYALTSGAPARTDCVEVTFASTLGGGRLHGCRGQARRICAAGSFHGIEQELRVACRRAGFPFTARS